MRLRAPDYYKNRHARNRAVILEALGNACSCCGITEKKFLVVDHIHNNGAEHRAKVGRGTGIYKDIVERGIPKDEFQLLCWNCNAAKGIYGICPHKET